MGEVLAAASQWSFVPMGILTFPLLRCGPFKASLSRKWLNSESSAMSVMSESESCAVM